MPINHFYRQVDAKLDLNFVREWVGKNYSPGMGRPSIDPEVFFKLQLIMFFEGIRSERQLMVQVSDGAKRYLAEHGYDPVFGARPIKRAIQRDLQDPLALYLLEGKIQDGESVYVDVSDSGEELVFTTVQPEMVE